MKRTSCGPEEIEKRIGHLGFMKRAKQVAEASKRQKTGENIQKKKKQTTKVIN